MTIYELWLKECERNKQKVYLLETGINRYGEPVKLIKLVTVIEPTKETGWHEFYETDHILFVGERFWNVRNYVSGYRAYRSAMQ